MGFSRNLPVLLLSIMAAGCTAGMPQADRADRKPQELPSKFRNKCDAAKGQPRPLVVEWGAPDRAALEALARHGQIVVHYEGCELEVLRSCTAPSSYAYKYTAITPKDERASKPNYLSRAS